MVSSAPRALHWDGGGGPERGRDLHAPFGGGPVLRDSESEQSDAWSPSFPGGEPRVFSLGGRALGTWPYHTSAAGLHSKMLLVHGLKCSQGKSATFSRNLGICVGSRGLSPTCVLFPGEDDPSESFPPECGQARPFPAQAGEVRTVAGMPNRISPASVPHPESSEEEGVVVFPGRGSREPGREQRNGLSGAVAAMGNPTVQSKHSVVSTDPSLSLRR